MIILNYIHEITTNRKHFFYYDFVTEASFLSLIFYAGRAAYVDKFYVAYDMSGFSSQKNPNINLRKYIWSYNDKN